MTERQVTAFWQAAMFVEEHPDMQTESPNRRKISRIPLFCSARALWARTRLHNSSTTGVQTDNNTKAGELGFLMRLSSFIHSALIWLAASLIDLVDSFYIFSVLVDFINVEVS